MIFGPVGVFHVVKVYHMLKQFIKNTIPKGFEVIAVSVDENRNAWIEAVKQDSLDEWHNILIAEKWPTGPYTNDDIFQNYYYRAIPEQLLIDKNGKIH